MESESQESGRKKNNSPQEQMASTGSQDSGPGENILSSAVVPDEFCQCYCKKERNFNKVELQCSSCQKWFHEACLDIPLVKCLPFMTNYTFTCRLCSPLKLENFLKKQANFSQMCITAIANLIQKSIAEGAPKTMFSKDKEIIPFIEKNWECLTTMPRRVKNTWHQTVFKTLGKDSDIFSSEGESYIESPNFGLIHQDLHKIGPYYESMIRPTTKHGQDSQFSGTGLTKGRTTKRKLPDSQTSTYGKKTKSDLVMPKLPPHGYPLEHPFNKDGYRYILAEPDPHAPFRQEFDDSLDWAGKPIPSWLYRVLSPNSVMLAMHDRAPQLKVSDDRLTAYNEKGYCMVRATHGVNRGTWYLECTIEDMPDNSAARIGWSQQLGNLQAPLGYDNWSYSWRSRKGTKFHQSKGIHYTDGGYAQGDIIGLLIHLPPERTSCPLLPPVHKDKVLVKFKNYLYFEEKDEAAQALKNLKPLYKNCVL